MGKKLDLTGQRFDRLTVIGQAQNDRATTMWMVRCDCGREFTTRTVSLRTGHTTSCGCSRTKHGESPTPHRPASPEYSTWLGMVNRCENPTDIAYQLYGGRGIRVCPEWRADYRAFLTDMGRKPSRRHSIDRIDPNGNYEPGNCRWATPTEQARNKRTSHVLSVEGVSHTIAEWAERTGIGYTTIRERIRRGWDPRRALNTPVR